MTIFANNLRRMFRKKSSWIFLLVIPILLNIFIVLISSQEATWVIGVHDKDKDVVSAAFKESFDTDATIVDIGAGDSISEGLNDSDYDLAVSFPAGYSQDVIDGEAPVVEINERGDNNQSDSLKSSINSFLSGTNAIGEAVNGDETEFDEGLENYLEKKFQAEYLDFERGDVQEANRAITTLGYLAFGLVLMMGSAASLLLEDRVRGIYDRVRLTPLPASSYFLQYFLSMVTIALVQVAVVLSIIPMMTDITYGSNVMQIAGIVGSTFCFVVFCVALSVLINRYAKTIIFSTTLYSLITLPMLMLSGALWPRDIMPEAMQTIGNFMPVRWFLDAAEAVIRQDDVVTIATPLAGLLGLSAVLLLATFLFRTEKYR